MRNFACCLCGFLALALASRATSAKTPAELLAERRSTLAAVGEVLANEYPLYPLVRKIGKVYAQPISESDAEALRVHVAVVEAPAEASWTVVLRKKEDGDIVWRGKSEAGASGFWTDEVETSSLLVEVYSVDPDSPLRLKIDKIAAKKPTTIPLSIFGRNDLQSIRGQDQWLVNAGDAVARIRFVGDDGRSYVCTGFLVTAELMLTNQHCIASDAEMRSALIDFDFNSPAALLRPVLLRELSVSDDALDYSVIRLRQPLQRSALRLALDSQLGEHQLLAIVQHPAGRPKEVSVRDCRVQKARVQGSDDQAGDTDFSHECDTEGGSSGSPVLDRNDHRVVGLHHLGFRTTSALQVNRAVHIGLVLEDIQRKKQDVFAEITQAQTGLPATDAP